MAVMISTARDLVRSLLNSSTTYGSNDDTERHPDAEIDAAIQAADADIALLICSTPNHPERRKYVSTVGVAHAGLIPEHIGPIGAVLVGGKGANPLPAAEIESLRTGTLPTFGPYFDVVDQRLYFVGGASATVDIYTFIQSGNTLQAADQYLGYIVCRALAKLFGKEGAEISAASHFKSLADQYWELIKAGAEALPTVVAYQKSA